MSALAPYTDSIEQAFFIFPLVSAVITLPYLVVQYKKYGSVPFVRSLIVYSFVLYLMNLLFLVVLPLPTQEVAAALTTPRLSLVPFRFVKQIFSTGFSVRDPSSWIHTLKQSVTYEAIFNVALFFPLGIYLRYYFRCGFAKTLFFCFLGTLFCEVTQLTGIYGIYERAYRLFDVDDLFLNTFGGMLGFVMAPLFVLFLPTRERIDQMAREHGDAVPLPRRVLATAVDLLLLGGLFGGIAALFPQVDFKQLDWWMLRILMTVLYFSGWCWLWRGKTPGKTFFRLRLINDTGERPRFWQCLVRYGLLYGVLLNLPDMGMLCFKQVLTEGDQISFGWLVACAVVAVLCLLFLGEIVVRFFGQNKRFFYERISQTRNQNLIGLKKRLVKHLEQESAAKHTEPPPTR